MNSVRLALCLLNALVMLACQEGSVPLGPQPFDARVPADSPPGLSQSDAAPGADLTPLPSCDDTASVVLDSVDPRVVKADAILEGAFGGSRPGAAALIVLGGKVVLMKGYGLADVAQARPITPCSVFELASVSKHFTAAAVLLLAQEGKLSLDDDVRLYLPELPVYDAKNPIRLRNLLQHTSGLAEYEPWYFQHPSKDKLTGADVLGYVAKQPLIFATGTGWQYSNTAFVLAAQVAVRVSGRPYSQLMRERFFDPLGMKASLAHDELVSGVAGRVTGYLDATGTPSKDDSAIVGDGNIFTSVYDMARWDAAWRTPEILTAASVSQAYTPVPTGEGDECGLGWFIDRTTGKVVVWHDGLWAGTATYIERHVEGGPTIVILSNDESRDPYAEAARAIAALFPY